MAVRCIAALILLLAAVLPAAADTDLPFGKQKVRDYVLGRLSDMAGRELTVTGDIDIDLSWTPTMRLEGVRVANADWAKAPHLLEMDALEVDLDMHQLLKGQVHLPRLALIHPTLFLEVSKDGTPNWVLGGPRQTVVESAAAPGGKPGNLPAIDHLVVRGGELAYRDHRRPDPHWVRGHIDEAGARLNEDGVDAALTGSLGEEPFTIVLHTASLDDLRAGAGPNPVYLLATAGSSRIRVQGTAVAPFRLRGIDLALDAHGRSFDELPLLAGLPPSPPFDVDGRLYREGAVWRLERLDASIGRSRMSADLALDLGGERPRLTADLDAKTLAVGQLLSLVPHRGRPAREAGGAIDLSGLTALDADISANADKLLFHQLRLDQVQARLTLQDGMLTLAPLSAAMGGGRVSTELRLQTDPVQGHAQVKLDDLRPAEALTGDASEAVPPGVIDGVVAVELPPPQTPRDRSEIRPGQLLERLRVEHGRLQYREPNAGTRVRLMLASGPDRDGVRLRLGGQWQGLSVDGQLQTDPLQRLVAADRFRIDGRLDAGDSDLSGHVSLDTGGPRPAIVADLSSDTLDLPELLPEKTAAAPKEGQHTPALPDLLTDVDARLDYRAERLVTPDATIADLTVQTRLEQGRLRLGPLRLNYRQPAQQTRLDIRLDAAGGDNDRLTGRANGRLRGQPIDARLRADAWLDLTEQGPPGSWQIRISPGDTTLRASGTLEDLLSPSTLDLKLAASGPSPARLSDLLGVPLPETPPYRLDLNLSRDGGRYVIDDLDATVGESDLDGRIAIDTDNVPTAVNIDLQSDRLDLDDLLAVMKPAAPQHTGNLFSERPLGLAALGRRVQGRLSYRAAEIVAAKVPLSSVRLEARLRDRRLHLDPLRIGVGGGTLRLNLDLDTAAAPPAADLGGKLRGVDLRRALAAYDIADRSLGNVGGQLKLWMEGRSPAAMAASADGGLFLLMTGGKLDDLLVQAADLDVGGAALAMLHDHPVPIDCAYLNLHARDGQVDIKTLAVDTSDTLFVGGGNIDLDRQRLDLVVDPRPKEPSLPAFGSPLRLQGPLAKPSLNLISPELVGRALAAIGLAAAEPLAGLIPLLQTGGSGGSPYCHGLMDRLQAARQ